jgi:hypothetical protein
MALLTIQRNIRPYARMLGCDAERDAAPSAVSGLAVNVLADLEEFVTDHRAHGTMTGEATEPAWNGCLTTADCPCGVTFARWVTPEYAALDLFQPATSN